MSKLKFQTLTGMHDILPGDFSYFNKIEKAVESVAKYYNFQRIETPILEQADLFLRGVGQDTDIVGKEMYTFRTKGGDMVALRPEGTASVMRSYLEHGMHSMPQPVKMWYMGQFFRYERPQAGRFRQFWQFGFESIGEKKASIDSQIIQMSYDVLKELDIKNVSLQVNSIGDSECRPYFKKMLTNYFKSKRASLSTECQRRVKDNPFRILDCKDEKCQIAKAESPQMIDHLCDSCHAHFKDVLEFLDELNLPYELNPNLVRGLDYYTKTVFEILEKSEEGNSLGSLVAGGRYDGLSKILGTRDVPACGAAGGVNRIIELMKTQKGKKKAIDSENEIFLAQLGQMAKRKSMKLFEEFREAKIPVAESFSKDSLRSQLKVADKMGARWTMILGQKEALEDFITLRDMKTGAQENIPLERVVSVMKEKMEGKIKKVKKTKSKKKLSKNKKSIK